jgi:hypothetical protein
MSSFRRLWYTMYIDAKVILVETIPGNEGEGIKEICRG